MDDPVTMAKAAAEGFIQQVGLELDAPGSGDSPQVRALARMWGNLEGVIDELARRLRDERPPALDPQSVLAGIDAWAKIENAQRNRYGCDVVAEGQRLAVHLGLITPAQQTMFSSEGRRDGVDALDEAMAARFDDPPGLRPMVAGDLLTTLYPLPGMVQS